VSLVVFCGRPCGIERCSGVHGEDPIEKPSEVRRIIERALKFVKEKKTSGAGGRGVRATVIADLVVYIGAFWHFLAGPH
jgi:hypothetical protein